MNRSRYTPPCTAGIKGESSRGRGATQGKEDSKTLGLQLTLPLPCKLTTCRGLHGVTVLLNVAIGPGACCC
jgi:hypothetical protein